MENSHPIRPETPADITEIHDLTVEAFETAPYGSANEQEIISRLREANALTLSLVAEHSGTLLGHVAVSPVTISDGATGWYGLGPISVRPEHQRRGIGSKLMQAALKDLRLLQASGCVVLGDPQYYRRFGFLARSGLILPGVPPEYFQVVSFGGSIPVGTVTYHPAFGAEH